MRSHTTEILLIGGSAGSISVLKEVLSQLTQPLIFPIMIVLHRKSYPESMLEELLAVYSKAPVVETYDKMTLQANCVYVVPADYHILFESKKEVSLDSSEKVNYSRPSIDVTFHSAAQVFGEHTTALLLSGANQDGVEGLRYIKQVGGTVLVQHPQTAEVAYMPQQAIKQVEVDEILNPQMMASFINQLNIQN